jgi:hypothetical protein
MLDTPLFAAVHSMGSPSSIKYPSQRLIVWPLGVNPPVDKTELKQMIELFTSPFKLFTLFHGQSEM